MISKSISPARTSAVVSPLLEGFCEVMVWPRSPRFCRASWAQAGLTDRSQQLRLIPLDLNRNAADVRPQSQQKLAGQCCLSELRDEDEGRERCQDVKRRNKSSFSAADEPIAVLPPHVTTAVRTDENSREMILVLGSEQNLRLVRSEPAPPSSSAALSFISSVAYTPHVRGGRGDVVGARRTLGGVGGVLLLGGSCSANKLLGAKDGLNRANDPADITAEREL